MWCGVVGWFWIWFRRVEVEEEECFFEVTERGLDDIDFLKRRHTYA